MVLVSLGATWEMTCMHTPWQGVPPGPQLPQYGVGSQCSSCGLVKTVTTYYVGYALGDSYMFTLVALENASVCMGPVWSELPALCFNTLEQDSV
jgi:hypothetical protein